MAQEFNFHPPLSHDRIESVRQQILAHIPHYEIVKRNYFESCLESLVHYAITTHHEHKNFTLDIARFDPHFDSERSVETKSDWDHDKVWIKIRVSGGMGSAFKDRYMATHFGVRRIDWKRKAHHVLKGNAVPLVGKAVAHATDGTPMAVLGIIVDAACDYSGEKLADKLKDNVKERAHARFHQHSESKQHLIHELRTITAAELHTITAEGELPELSHMVLRNLLASGESKLSRQKFTAFWNEMLTSADADAIHEWNRVAGDNSAITSTQFIHLFEVVMQKLTRATAT